jgi:ABC-2 type transport system permease protein/oleandomycin transport system permease protein
MTFPLIFPLTFASTIFIPLYKLPHWMQGFANNQPVSQATDAVRSLMLGYPVGNHVWMSLIWSAGIIAVLAPLAVNQFRKVA